MKRFFLALLIGAVLSGCAATGGRMVEMDSPSKVALLRERAVEYWTAAVKQDYEKTFSLFDPFFRAATNKYKFMGSQGAVKYHSFEIKDIKVDGNVAHVKVGIVYSVPKIKFKTQEFSKPETATEFEESWLFVYDYWYKEYIYDEATGKGVADY